VRFVRLGHCVALVFVALVSSFGAPLLAQTGSFQHIVVVVQENRTPDNLFYALCTIPELCSAMPSALQYNIQTRNWLDKSAPGGVITPLAVELANDYDLNHAHIAFQQQCNMNGATKACSMDGGASVACSGTCPTQPSFRYVDNSTGILDPYLDLIKQYGWANYMFQTNQGPSFPAHQFIFGGTSAPTAADDAAGIFADSNIDSEVAVAGCIASAGATVALVSTVKLADGYIYPCFQHDTVPDVLPASVSWRYYASAAGSIWTAPNAIQHICEPSAPAGGECEGQKWKGNVDLISADVLKDISNCTLRNLSWVTPSGQNSDHADVNTGGGPDWVASIVNAIGESACKNADGSSYWESTAILITWDDWGGWYDHEAPTILPQPQGDYQYGFRVPLIVVSAYTPHMIDNTRYDFGSILRFIEHNFGVTEGALNFADKRADNTLSGFFDLRLLPRPFAPISTTKDAEFFLNDKTPPTDPDDD
jgi:phospholipase C